MECQLIGSPLLPSVGIGFPCENGLDPLVLTWEKRSSGFSNVVGSWKLGSRHPEVARNLRLSSIVGSIIFYGNLVDIEVAIGTWVDDHSIWQKGVRCGGPGATHIRVGKLHS
jgi:hypothetical protein